MKLKCKTYKHKPKTPSKKQVKTNELPLNYPQLKARNGCSLWFLFGEESVVFFCCSLFVLLTSLHTQLNGKMMLKTKKRRDERTIETPFLRTKK